MVEDKRQAQTRDKYYDIEQNTTQYRSAEAIFPSVIYECFNFDQVKSVTEGSFMFIGP